MNYVYCFLACVCSASIGYVYGHIQEAEYWDQKMTAVKVEYEQIQKQTDAESTRRIQNLQSVTAKTLKQESDLKRKFDSYVAELDRMHADNSSSKTSVSDSATAPTRTEPRNTSRCNGQRNAGLERKILIYAEKADECAVKFNSLLELYRSVQDGSRGYP